jgi:hypothetical protein
MMPWFPGDFMRSTRGWSLTARAVYRELLDAQWDLGALPSGPQELAEMIGANPGEWSKGWSKCECKFPVGNDGQRRNLRLEEHRSKSKTLADRRSEMGRKGGLTSAASKAQAKLEAQVKPGSSPATAGLQAGLKHPSPLLSDPIQSSPIRSIPILSDPESSVHTSAPKSHLSAPRAARSASTGTRLPEDFGLTEARRRYATDYGVNPERTFTDFTEYWRAKAGANARKADWNLTWQTWVRKAADEKPRHLNGHSKSNDAAAWAEARAAAKEIGFRDPYAAETPTSYMNAVKRARDRVKNPSPVPRALLDKMRITK